MQINIDPENNPCLVETILPTPIWASNCVPLPEGFLIFHPRDDDQYSWVSTSWYCWAEPTSCMGFSWVVQLAGCFNGVFPASIEPSCYSCRIAELCQSLVSYLVHEPGTQWSWAMVGDGFWAGTRMGLDQFRSTDDLRSLNLHEGVCWYMLLTFKVESLVFSCPNDACRVPHIDYPKNCHEGQRGGAQIWAPMDPHNCEEEHFPCSAGTRKSRNPIVYVIDHQIPHRNWYLGIVYRNFQTHHMFFAIPLWTDMLILYLFCRPEGHYIMHPSGTMVQGGFNCCMVKEWTLQLPSGELT